MSTTQVKYAASYARVAQGDSSRIEEQHRRNAMQARRDGFAVPEGPTTAMMTTAHQASTITVPAGVGSSR